MIVAWGLTEPPKYCFIDWSFPLTAGEDVELTRLGNNRCWVLFANRCVILCGYLSEDVF